MGLHLGQGFLFSKPKEVPTPFLFSENLPDYEPRKLASSAQTVSSIMRMSPSTPPDTKVGLLIDQFRKDETLRCVVVVRDARPVGMVSRQMIIAIYASRYGEALYDKRPVTEIMQDNIVIAKVDTPLDTLSEQITTQNDDLPEKLSVD